MNRLLAIVLGVAIIVVSGVAYYFLRPPAAPSGEITAIPVATGTIGAAESVTAASSTGATIFEIVRDESEARFVIDEVLNGSPKTVIGTTGQVAGQIIFNPDDPGAARIGAVRINARTFTTDSDQRNRAIQNSVLDTRAYKYITFAPTQLEGLPERANIGEAYIFQIVGDLTIRDVTREATFEVSVTPAAGDRLRGTATTTIKRADWNINIPQPPFVASVSDEIRLELDFVAVTS